MFDNAATFCMLTLERFSNFRIRKISVTRSDKWSMISNGRWCSTTKAAILISALCTFLTIVLLVLWSCFFMMLFGVFMLLQLRKPCCHFFCTNLAKYLVRIISSGAIHSFNVGYCSHAQLYLCLYVLAFFGRGKAESSSEDIHVPTTSAILIQRDNNCRGSYSIDGLINPSA